MEPTPERKEIKYTLKLPKSLMGEVEDLSEERGSSVASEMRRASRLLILVEEYKQDPNWWRTFFNEQGQPNKEALAFLLESI